MKILQDLESFLNEFNSINNIIFSIDTIRVNFNKQHKLLKLQELGKWNKINKNDRTILNKLKERLTDDEVTSAYQLEDYNIYYYNSNKDKPKYRKATLVIFGLKQYNKNKIPHQIISNIISILKDITNIDLCFDMNTKPNIQALKKKFNITQYITKEGVYTDTYYIYNTGILMLDKITIYNKALKNNLDGILWRIEALISIPNIKLISFPLNEFKELISIAKG